MKKFHYYLCMLGFCVLSVPTQINAQDLECQIGTINAPGTIGFQTFVANNFHQGAGISDLEIEVVDLNDPSNVYNGIDEVTVEITQEVDVTFEITIIHPISNDSCTTLISYSFADCVDTMFIDFRNDIGIDQIVVDVQLLSNQDIQSLQWTLQYDPDLLDLTAFTPGVLSSIGLFNTNEFEPGVVNFVWGNATADPNFTAGSTLFSMEFDVLANGTSTIGIIENNYPGSIETEAGNSDQETICINTSSATVTANGVKVEGNLSRNEDLSCTALNPEALKDWIVRISNGTEEYFTSSDDDGAYKRIVPPGNYTVTAYPYSLMWGFCENNVDVSLPMTGDQTTVDFTANAQLACSYLDVDLFAPFLRRCFENTYYLEYCNQGTANADNAYIEIELDPFLTMIGASTTFTQVGQLVTFDLGTVGLECGWISFEVELSCDAELGETHCTTATIYPQDPCDQALVGWNGPVIDVTANCDGDSIRFTVTNTSMENMLASAEFIVVEDDVMTQIGDFQLNALASAEYGFLAEGATLRFNAMQSNGFPYDEFATAYVEGCGTDADGNISIGFINDFPLGDYEAFMDIDCQENVGSYDPNDKVSFPEGYGDEHYVKRDLTIDYKIRFQNTGTDTAFRVMVIDTLSEFLDIRTFKRTAFSHANEMSIEDRVVSFRFDNIQLVDSFTNEVASHGFVSFQIDMLEDLPDGTLINNNADIYFDFNDPINTNETFLEIGTDFIDDASLSTIDNPENILVHIVPNPATESSVIYITDVDSDQMQIEIYNVIGKLITGGQIENSQFDLSGRGLSKGTYLVRLVNAKKKVFSGKLIVH